MQTFGRNKSRRRVQAQDYEQRGQRCVTKNGRMCCCPIVQSKRTMTATEGLDYSSVIDEEEIAEVLAQWTGIPVHRLTEEETTSASGAHGG